MPDPCQPAILSLGSKVRPAASTSVIGILQTLENHDGQPSGGSRNGDQLANLDLSKEEAERAGVLCADRLGRTVGFLDFES
jgi:hypothetical protein